VTGSSYLTRALAAGPNRGAAALTVVIACGVVAIARVPLAPGSEVDLREADHVDGWVQASLSGFGDTDERGRLIAAGPVQIVWNRPLPSRFTLALDAGADNPRAALRVRLGDRETTLPVSPRGPTHVVLDNPHALRALELAAVPPGARVRLRRAAVR
jgi:hypothetical protein